MSRLTSYSSFDTFRCNCKFLYYCIIFLYIFKLLFFFMMFIYPITFVTAKHNKRIWICLLICILLMHLLHLFPVLLLSIQGCTVCVSCTVPATRFYHKQHESWAVEFLCLWTECCYSVTDLLCTVQFITVTRFWSCFTMVPGFAIYCRHGLK